MDLHKVMRERDFCWVKMQEAYWNYYHWYHAFQHFTWKAQPFLQFNPSFQLNPDINVSPITQVNPHVEVNPQTQINPKLLSDIELSPTTQAYFNFDPDFHLQFGK